MKHRLESSYTNKTPKSNKLSHKKLQTSENKSKLRNAQSQMIKPINLTMYDDFKQNTRQDLKQLESDKEVLCSQKKIQQQMLQQLQKKYRSNQIDKENYNIQTQKLQSKLQDTESNLQKVQLQIESQNNLLQSKTTSQMFTDQQQNTKQSTDQTFQFKTNLKHALTSDDNTIINPSIDQQTFESPKHNKKFFSQSTKKPNKNRYIKQDSSFIKLENSDDSLREATIQTERSITSSRNHRNQKKNMHKQISNISQDYDQPQYQPPSYHEEYLEERSKNIYLIAKNKELYLQKHQSTLEYQKLEEAYQDLKKQMKEIQQGNFEIRSGYLESREQVQKIKQQSQAKEIELRQQIQKQQIEITALQQDKSILQQNLHESNTEKTYLSQQLQAFIDNYKKKSDQQNQQQFTSSPNQKILQLLYKNIKNKLDIEQKLDDFRFIQKQSGKQNLEEKYTKKQQQQEFKNIIKSLQNEIKYNNQQYQ